MGASDEVMKVGLALCKANVPAVLSILWPQEYYRLSFRMSLEGVLGHSCCDLLKNLPLALISEIIPGSACVQNQMWFLLSHMQRPYPLYYFSGPRI